jgi:hypothetical protein
MRDQLGGPVGNWRKPFSTQICGGIPTDGTKQIEDVNRVRSQVQDFTMRFFPVFERGLATIPQPQRDWLHYLPDHITAHAWLKAVPVEDPAHEVFLPSSITQRIEPELRWIEWSQAVLLMIVTGSTQIPPEPPPT